MFLRAHSLHIFLFVILTLKVFSFLKWSLFNTENLFFHCKTLNLEWNSGPSGIFDSNVDFLCYGIFMFHDGIVHIHRVWFSKKTSFILIKAGNVSIFVNYEATFPFKLNIFNMTSWFRSSRFPFLKYSNSLISSPSLIVKAERTRKFYLKSKAAVIMFYLAQH